MKLSFSKTSSKTTAKPPLNFPGEAQNDEEKVRSQQFVTEFDASKTLINTNPSKFVIPPLPNEWQPMKKMKNLELPVGTSGGDLQFEIETPSVTESLDSGMSFGLNLRNGGKEDAVSFRSEANGGEKPRQKPVTVENGLLQSLKDDLERLPEHSGAAEFDEVPVDDFAFAVLSSYGYYEGRGVGKNPKGDVIAKQCERRVGKAGLGFVPDAPVREDLKEREREKPREDIHKVGKDVRIIGGRDIGSKGKVIGILNDDMLILKLSRSGEEVRVRVRDVADLDSKEEEKCLRMLKHMKNRETKDKHHPTSEKIDDTRKVASKRSREDDERKEEVSAKHVSWLSSHIRVRIISKKLKGGKFYLKKGEIVDVVGPKTCDIAMDGSRELIQGVDQELLETALPHRGGPVRILSGKYKGVFGNLVEKDMEKETGVVRDADSHELINVNLEQIAEYIGDPSLIGY